jgi:hypothetical protein
MAGCVASSHQKINKKINKKKKCDRREVATYGQCYAPVGKGSSLLLKKKNKKIKKKKKM